MSSSFSFSRLGKLITKQLFENSRLYIFSALALFGLLALVFAFWLYLASPNYYEENTYVIFLAGLLITGSAFASMSFSMLGSKDKGIYWLGVPATHLEKLLCTIFFSVVLFTLCYCLCFYIVKSLSVLFLESYIKQHAGVSYIKMADNNKNFEQGFKYSIYTYFAVQSLYLLGSVYFPRYSFITTTVAGAALFFVFGYYMTKVEDGLLGPVNWDLVTVTKNDPSMKDAYMQYSVSPTVSGIVIFALKFIWAPLFWIAAWYRLKEKEI